MIRSAGWLVAMCGVVLLGACATAPPPRLPPSPPPPPPLPTLPDIVVPQPSLPPPVVEPPSPPPKPPKKRAEPPAAVVALVQRADAQVAAGNLDAAVSTLEQAIRVAPKQPLPWYRLVQIKVKQGDCGQAAQFARKADTLSDDPAMREQTQQLLGKCKEKKP